MPTNSAAMTLRATAMFALDISVDGDTSNSLEPRVLKKTCLKIGCAVEVRFSSLVSFAVGIGPKAESF